MMRSDRESNEQGSKPLWHAQLCQDAGDALTLRNLALFDAILSFDTTPYLFPLPSDTIRSCLTRLSPEARPSISDIDPPFWSSEAQHPGITKQRDDGSHSLIFSRPRNTAMQPLESSSLLSAFIPLAFPLLMQKGLISSQGLASVDSDNPLPIRFVSYASAAADNPPEKQGRETREDSEDNIRSHCLQRESDPAQLPQTSSRHQAESLELLNRKPAYTCSLAELLIGS
jgi:hypothetical protein